MVKLTVETIENARQFVNPVQDRELDLRGYKIPVLENLGATYNQFDTFDFTDNDIKRLENVPLLPRLKCLFLTNNRISFIDPDLKDTIYNVHTIVLTNNNIQELGDIDALKGLPKLQYLSLMGNPVTKKPHYRSYVIWRLPQVRVIDYKRIRQKERDTAKELFKGKKGRELREQLVKTSKTFNPSEMPSEPAVNGTSAPSQPRPDEDVQKIKDAIAGASSLQEMERIQEMLEQGQIPGLEQGKGAAGGAAENGGGEEVEMEEDEPEPLPTPVLQP